MPKSTNNNVLESDIEKLENRLDRAKIFIQEEKIKWKEAQSPNHKYGCHWKSARVSKSKPDVNPVALPMPCSLSSEKTDRTSNIMSDWSAFQVGEWLCDQGIPELVSNVLDHHIGGHAILNHRSSPAQLRALFRLQGDNDANRSTFFKLLQLVSSLSPKTSKKNKKMPATKKCPKDSLETALMTTSAQPKSNTTQPKTQPPSRPTTSAGRLMMIQPRKPKIIVATCSTCHRVFERPGNCLMQQQHKPCFCSSRCSTTAENLKQELNVGTTTGLKTGFLVPTPRIPKRHQPSKKSLNKHKPSTPNTHEKRNSLNLNLPAISTTSLSISGKHEALAFQCPTSSTRRSKAQLCPSPLATRRKSSFRNNKSTASVPNMSINTKISCQETPGHSRYHLDISTPRSSVFSNAILTLVLPWCSFRMMCKLLLLDHETFSICTQEPAMELWKQQWILTLGRVHWKKVSPSPNNVRQKLIQHMKHLDRVVQENVRKILKKGMWCCVAPSLSQNEKDEELEIVVDELGRIVGAGVNQLYSTYSDGKEEEVSTMTLLTKLKMGEFMIMRVKRCRMYSTTTNVWPMAEWPVALTRNSAPLRIQCAVFQNAQQQTVIRKTQSLASGWYLKKKRDLVKQLRVFEKRNRVIE